MWIKRFEAVNIGPFGPDRFLDLQFVRGLVGVVGPNGVGKSMILDLTYACLTNDFGRYDGLKTDLINNQAPADEDSFVRVELEHNGTNLQVTRSLRPSKSYLVIDGDVAGMLTDARKIQDRIEEILGVDRRMLDLFCFKQQDRIFDFLSVTDAERKKSFASLCRTEGCEQLWEMLNGFLNKDEDLRTELVDNSDELVSGLATVAGELKQKQAEQATIQAQLAKPDTLKLWQDVLRRAESRARLLDDREAKFNTLNAAQANYDEAVRSQGIRSRKTAALNGEITISNPNFLNAQIALRRWSEYEQQAKQQAKVLAESDAIAVATTTLAPPKKPNGLRADFDPTAARQLQSAYQARLDHANTVIAQFDETGLTECPTCGTPVESMESHLFVCRQDARLLPAEIETLKTRCASWEAYQVKQREHVHKLDLHRVRVEANEAALAAMNGLVPPGGDQKALRLMVETHEQLVTELQESEAKLKSWNIALSARKTELAHVKQRITELDQELAECDVSSEALTDAKSVLTHHEVQSHAIARLQGEIDVLTRNHAALTAQLGRLRAKMARTKKVREMARIVERTRDVLHRDRLPNRVAQKNLRRMEGGINAGLELFDSPFWCETTDDLNFVIHKPGEPPQPAGWLSTGQRVILAVPFWLTVGSLWKLELGMLALDEPTANLDETNRSFLAAALANLAGRVRDSMQILLVTHADNLRTCFDQVIDLNTQPEAS